MLIYWRLINYLGLFKVIWLIFPMVNPLLGETMKGTWFISPFVRWGLLDFMSACPPPSSSLLLPPPSSSFLLLPPPSSSFLRRTSAASSRSQCSPPDPNSNVWIKVFPAGPQQQRISKDRMPDAHARKNVVRYGIYQVAFLPVSLGNYKQLSLTCWNEMSWRVSWVSVSQTLCFI